MPALNVAAASATIGSFVFSGLGLGHLLLKDTVKYPSTIVEEARVELSKTLANLNTFQSVIHDDFIFPLFNRYERLDDVLTDLEDRIKSPKSFKKIKSYGSNMREAKRVLKDSHFLRREVRAASDKGTFANLKKTKGLAPGTQPVHSTPRPIPVAGRLGPLYSTEPTNLSTTSFSYPPRHRAGSLASIVSDPFRDPIGMTPV